MTEKPREPAGRGKGMLSLMCTILLLSSVLILSLRGIRNMSREYQALLHMDLSSGSRGSIGYEDGLFGSIESGIEIDPSDSEKGERLRDFTESSLRAIDKRILTCILIYTMLISAAASYWLYVRYGRDRLKHVLSIFIAVMLLYAVLLAAILMAGAASGMPFYFPGAGEIPLLIVSIPAVLGGSCFLGWLLRMIRFKRIAALMALPAVLLHFMQGTVFEAGRFCAPEVPSFAYIAEEIEPRIYEDDYEGTVYYDQEKDVIVLNGAEYPPRQAPNPDYLTGTGRAAACIFEILSPYSGNGLFMIHEAENIRPAAGILSLYVLNALAFAALPLLSGNRKRPEQ